MGEEAFGREGSKRHKEHGVDAEGGERPSGKASLQTANAEIAQV